MVKVISKNSVRIILSVLVVFLLTSTFAAGMGYSGTVLATQGVVRSTNAFDGEEVTTLPIGTRIWVEEINNDWYRIANTTNTLTGWMYKDLVALDNVKTEVRRGQVTVSTLNVRKSPSTDASIIRKLNRNAKVTIISLENEWYEILLSQVEKGWIHSDYIQLIPNFAEGRITSDQAVMMETKDKNSKVIKSLELNEVIYIKDYQDGWYSIVLADFTEGWIEGSFGELQISSSIAVSRSGQRTGIFTDLEEVTSKYLGKKYSWGQTGPNLFDCSGFTTYIFKTYYGDYLSEKDINLPRTSREQATIGTSIDKESLIIGDLVFFNTESKISRTVTHVGIYLGNGDFVHASSSGGNVIVSSLEEGYYKQRYLKAVRL